MIVTTENGQQKMSGKIRTIGITLFGLVEILKHMGVNLGVNQDDIYTGLEVVTGAIAGIGAAISWGKLVYRKLTEKG
jgi:hypothetical protein